MKLEDNELQAIKRDGLLWGVLKCLHGVLSEIGFDIPKSVESKLEVVRSIIETGCSNIKHVDELLEEIEHTLISKLVSLDRSFYWFDILIEAKNGGLERKKIMEVPLMRDMARRYEFLGYCLPPASKASGLSNS